MWVTAAVRAQGTLLATLGVSAASVQFHGFACFREMSCESVMPCIGIHGVVSRRPHYFMATRGLHGRRRRRAPVNRSQLLRSSGDYFHCHSPQQQRASQSLLSSVSIFAERSTLSRDAKSCARRETKDFIEAGFLQLDKTGKSSQPQDVPGHARSCVYCVSAAILD